jgi:hypothetical protein
MARLIAGFEYNIFIPYLRKDNKHKDWVTEFDDNLKGELEYILKEEISVYFDINSHDGLLEIHDVDALIKDKMKCLIFIPVTSNTYCDPKAFSMEHKLIAFVQYVSAEQLGLSEEMLQTETRWKHFMN